MQTLTLLGKSDVTISMIMDVLESKGMFPEIKIVNNLDLPIEHTFNNPKFKWEITNKLTGGDTFALGVSNSSIKRKILNTFGEDMNFINLIHNTASISSTTTLEKGCTIHSNVSISAHSHLGKFVSVNRNSSIGHHTNIGDFVSINPSVAIAGHVNIGEGTVIGIGAIVSDHVNIGKNCVIGAGSIVIKDIPDDVVAYGSPCKIVRKTNI
jgi:sugar O-acyltransferase (sialic acid O-acetyltransferase NeuD family)